MKYYYLLVLSLSSLFLSCEDTLRMIPENSVTFENAFENEHEIEIGLLSVERYVRKGLYVVTSPTDYGEYTDSRGSRDAGLLRENSPGTYMFTWFPYYDIIAMANVVLPYIDKVKMSQERRDFYKGQVYFTKALAYSELGRKWGNCPIIRDEVEYKPIGSSSWVEVIDYAIELAQEAANLLPEYPNLTDYKGNAITYKSTPSKGAAQALLAHLCAWKAGCKYMAQPEEATYDERALWVKADSVCTALIMSGVYGLANSPEKICTSTLVGGDPESIYEIVLRDCWDELESEDPISVHDLSYCFGRYYQTWPVIPGEEAFHAVHPCLYQLLGFVCRLAVRDPRVLRQLLKVVERHISHDRQLVVGACDRGVELGAVLKYEQIISALGSTHLISTRKIRTPRDLDPHALIGGKSRDLRHRRFRYRAEVYARKRIIGACRPLHRVVRPHDLSLGGHDHGGLLYAAHRFGHKVTYRRTFLFAYPECGLTAHEKICGGDRNTVDYKEDQRRGKGGNIGQRRDKGNSRKKHSACGNAYEQRQIFGRAFFGFGHFSTVPFVLRDIILHRHGHCCRRHGDRRSCAAAE